MEIFQVSTVTKQRSSHVSDQMRVVG